MSAAEKGRLFALLGRPVQHSLSPAIHAAAFDALGVDAVYVPLVVREEELDGVLPAVARAGGGNVTVPHKEAAARRVERPTEAVRRTGACNCFWLEDGRLAGDNTDVGGFLAAVEAWPEVRLRGARVLLLGAGGGARAVVAALRRENAGSVEVWNRTTERARSMIEDAGGGAGETELRVVRSRTGSGGEYDLVVNATTLGLDPDDPLPVDLGRLRAAAAFDLVYAEGGTPWTRHARELGVPAREGSEMLVQQAGLSLRRWLDVSPPLDAMRRAVRAATGGGE